MKKTKRGFTIIELIVILGMASILFLFASVSLLTVSRSSSLDTAVTTLINDIKGQQTRAMTGDTAGTGLADSYGILFEENRYTLFKGSEFSPNDQNNFQVNLENISLANITLPNATVVFAKGSGEVSGYISGADSVSVREESSGQTKTLQINQYGAVDVQ